MKEELIQGIIEQTQFKTMKKAIQTNMQKNVGFAAKPPGPPGPPGPPSGPPSGPPAGGPPPGK